MPDILRIDGRISRTLPNAYSELMQPVCGGHALWFPRKVALGGGALGDIGCIDDGAFEKTFNVYESLPGDLSLLQRPMTGVTLDEHFNMPSMRSSRRSTIDLYISGSSTVASLPLSVSPATIEPRINLQEEKFAFLIPPQPVQMDHLSLDRRDELRNWLTAHRRMLREGTIIITKVVRSSGWLGGVATGRKVETGAALSADAPSLGRVEFGASRTYEATLLADIKGPSDWTSTASAEYVLVIGFVMARGRFEQFRDRLRLAMPSSSTSYVRTMPPAQPGDVRNRPLGDSQPHASGYGDVETQPLDDVELHSEYDPPEERDSILLTTILDHILATNEDLDVVVADSSIITDFIEAYGVLPSPPEVEPVMSTRSVQVKDVVQGRVLLESAAFVDHLRPVGTIHHPVDPLFQPSSRTLSTSHATMMSEKDRLRRVPLASALSPHRLRTVSASAALHDMSAPPITTQDVTPREDIISPLSSAAAIPYRSLPMPSLDQLATKIEPAPSSTMSPASSMRPSLAYLLPGSSSSIVTAPSSKTAVSVDWAVVDPPDSPTDSSGRGSADEADVVAKLDKFGLGDPRRKAARGFKNIPSLEPITRRMNDRKRQDSYDPGSLVLTPDTERSKEDLLQVPPATAFEDQSASSMSKEHPLQNQWVLYYDTKAKLPMTPPEPSTPFVPPSTATGVREADLNVIGEFASVEAFCRYFNWLKLPSKLERNSNYLLFKKGINPTWEDKANASGGRWDLTMRHNPQLLDRCWNWLVFALIGEDLDDGEEICGAVVSLRSKQDRIQLWIRSKDDVEKINSIGKKLIKTLEVSEADGIGFEFQYNTDDRPPPQKFLSIQAPYPQPRYHQHNSSIGNNAWSLESDPPSGQSFNNFTPPSSSGPGQGFAFGPGMGAFGGWRGGPRRGGPPGGGPGHFQGPPPTARHSLEGVNDSLVCDHDGPQPSTHPTPNVDN